MTDSVRSVLDQALGLSDGERADVVAELLASLRPAEDATEAELRELWAEEIRRRVARVRSGADDAIDWETVRSKAEHRLSAG
jgi:putative addiction module component (TIGR02574 family)